MASKTLSDGRRVLVGSQADPSSERFLQASGGRSVQLADGTQLNAEQSRDYGKIPTVISSTSITENKIPELKNRANQILNDQSGQKVNQTGDAEGEVDFNEYSILGDEAKTADEGSDPILRQQLRMLDQQRKSSGSQAEADIARVQTAIQGLMGEQRAINEANTAGVRGSILRAGGSTGGGFRYAPLGAFGGVAAEATAGVRQLSNLVAKEQAMISEIRAAQEEKDYRSMQTKIGILDNIRKERAAKAAAIQDSIIKAQEKREKDVGEIMKEVAKNGAPMEVRQAIANSPDLNTAISNAGEWLQSGSGIVGEYLYYKRQAEAIGQVPSSFEEFQDRDANRKRSVVNIGIGGTGSYTPAQEKVITRVDSSISNNATYKKASSVNTSIDVINSALSQKNGLGDIAAINQFQKVIDEGAVTRDQDVKLIQGAQGLADSLNLMKDRVQSGQQLSDKQREQMKKLITDIQATQKTAINNDAFLQSKKKELERNGIDPGDTIFGALEGNSVANDLIQQEANARDRVIEVAALNPQAESQINLLIDQGIPYIEIINSLPELFK